MDLLLKNAAAYVEGKFQKLNIGIQDDKIAYIGEGEPKAKRIEDLSGKHILPGVIDSQVHFREPGLLDKEDIQHGSKAALLGGVTAYFEMPNTKPATTNRQAFEEKVRIAKKNSYTDFAFYIGATSENLNQLPFLERDEACCGVKTFMGSSTGNLLLYDEKDLEILVRGCKSTLSFHCEDEDRMIERKDYALRAKNPLAHPVWRDEKSAYLASEKILRIAKKANRRVHILHVTTKQEMELLRQNKEWASVEVLPQHLSLHAPDCYEEIGTLAQMNPPIRTKDHQEALWEAINDGTVDVLGSDHAPHTLDEKARTYPDSPSGMPGVESLLPLMLNHVNNGKLSLERLVELVCIKPLELFRIENRNPIIMGGDATFTIIDMHKEKAFKGHYKCGWSPFEGKKLKGWPSAVILHGQWIMQDQEILATPRAQALAFSQ